MKNGKKTSIGKKLRIGCIISITLLCVVLGLLALTGYNYGMIDQYRTYLYNVLNLALTEVDGDDLAGCIETKTASPAFENTQAFLNRIKENYELEYIYIIKPLNTNETDNIMDVMAGITAREAEEDREFYYVPLGRLSGTSYSPQVAAHYLKGMEADGITYFSDRTEYGWDYTGILPIRDSSGKPVAVIAADVSMKDIIEALGYFVVTMSVLIAILIVLTVWSISRWLNKRVIRPLEQLKETSESFVKNSRAVDDPEQLPLSELNIHTGDEMEELASSMSDMFADMKHYMVGLVEATREKERIGAELNVATQIQADMLPSIFPAFPDRSEFDLYASMRPAKEVGGDFYDFFFVDDDHLAMVMADVSGKGVPAALFMVIAKTLIKNQAMRGDSPAEILRNVNEQLCAGNKSKLFVTVWLAIVEISTGHGVATNAGHEHPAIRRKDGKYELSVYRHTPPVGVIEGLPFREHSFEMHPGDSLFVYTDGVTEASDVRRNLFGTDRMLEALNRDPDAGPEKQVPAVREAIDAFAGEAPQFDDITMLCFHYKGGNQ